MANPSSRIEPLTVTLKRSAILLSILSTAAVLPLVAHWSLALLAAALAASAVGAAFYVVLRHGMNLPTYEEHERK